MSTCTAARRSAVIGLGLLGTVALAGTAQAQSAPSPAGALPPAVAGVVDPLTTPLNGAVAAVAAAAQPVVSQAPAPVQDLAKQATSSLTGPPGTAPAPPGAPPGGTSTTPPKQAPQQQPAAKPAPASTTASASTTTTTAAPTGGTGVASMPDSLLRKLNALEQFNPGSGFANASNPMSLFGAPQIAPTAPVVAADQLPTPLAVRPAGAGLDSVLPVRAAQDLPAVLVAIAFTTAAAAGAAQVAVLRGRRTGAAPA